MKNSFLVLCFLAAACASKPQESMVPTVVTGIPPVALLVERIGGSEFSVKSIIPQGADPHNFSLKPSDALVIEKAKAVIVVHPHIDGAILRQGTNEFIFFNEKTEVFEDKHNHDGHNHDENNSHYWLSLVHSKDIALKTVEILTTLKPEKKDFFYSNALAFNEDIDVLAKELKALAKGKQIAVLQQHPAWDYFLDELGIKNLGSLQAFEGDQSSPAKLASLITLLKKQAPAVLIDDVFTAPSSALKVLEKETGAFYLVLNPMASDKGEEDIISILRSAGNVLLK